MSGRRIRLGMVGGGEGSFIGAAHRVAARLHDEFELVAGALSSDPARAAASGAGLRLAPERSYADFRRMASAEAARDDGIDAVVIVTPNHLHAPVAHAFLEHGIDIVCDKPLATSLEEADELLQAVRRSGRLFLQTYTYSGYPMVRHARELVAAGEIGTVRFVQVEYAQDWLGEPLERQGNKQAEWRNDPQRAGPAGALGDIGSHAFQLAGFVTGLEVEELAAELVTFVEGRLLDDHVQAMLRYAGGARGLLWASQVASGTRNGLRLRVFGTRGSLSFDQEAPEMLCLGRPGQPEQRIWRGAFGRPPSAPGLPAGHPEGYYEALGQLYREFAQQWRARDAGQALPHVLAPGIDEGRAGMAFIKAVLRSSRAGGDWVRLG
jgi:predicted dehydrogenase